LGLLVLLSFFWAPAKKLRIYFFLFLALYLLEKGFELVGTSSLWRSWFPPSSPFVTAMFGTQIRRMLVALAMILILWIIYKRPARFYLTPGKLDAPASKLSFLIDEGTSYKNLGWILALMITGGTLAFLWLSGRPNLNQLSGVLPLLPAVLILAAMNAFSEELSYRAAFLAPLSNAVGKTHSILLTATFFGLAHFYGVPYGVVGVIMAFVLGALLSKAMLETKGLFWPWFIHFWQDVAIFSFMAIG
jgi:membrane protease YdiL (CAAX protease family)